MGGTPGLDVPSPPSCAPDRRGVGLGIWRAGYLCGSEGQWPHCIADRQHAPVVADSGLRFGADRDGHAHRSIPQSGADGAGGLGPFPLAHSCQQRSQAHRDPDQRGHPKGDVPLRVGLGTTARDERLVETGTLGADRSGDADVPMCGRVGGFGARCGPGAMGCVRERDPGGVEPQRRRRSVSMGFPRCTSPPIGDSPPRTLVAGGNGQTASVQLGDRRFSGALSGLAIRGADPGVGAGRGCLRTGHALRGQWGSGPSAGSECDSPGLLSSPGGTEVVAGGGGCGVRPHEHAARVGRGPLCRRSLVGPLR